jgi:6-phospho-beta-glucosidase
MKLAIIGGGGVRTPLLVHGLTRSDVAIDSISLFDPDHHRLASIAPLAQQLSAGATVSSATSLDTCLEGADFVFTSIRVGGIEGRARDEQTALAHGVAGQETIGPAGFAMALRTIPHMIGYARAVQTHAPDAWIINFTNPVGMVTEAVRTATGARIIGICDTPTELFEEIAHALDLPSQDCYFDYFGLNHLGWVRQVYHRGHPVLAGLFEDDERLGRVYRAPLFDLEYLRGLRLLPTEYVYYYHRSRDAFEHLRRAGNSRGAVIQALNDRLFRDLAAAGDDGPAVYEDYLAARNAGYMQIETGSATARQPAPWAALTGYDKIALAVLRAIVQNSNAIIPLNVTNGANLPELEPTDVVEVPCVVNANGARPLHVGAVPPQVRDLLLQVKDYERRTVRAAISGRDADAHDALARNPLVADAGLAGRLLEALAAR